MEDTNMFYQYQGKKTVRCPKCRDMGWIFSKREGIYEYYKMCTCHPLYGKEDGWKTGVNWEDIG